MFWETLDLLLLAVSDRKRVGFSLILLCKNRFGFRSELAKSKKSIEQLNLELTKTFHLPTLLTWIQLAHHGGSTGAD